MLAMYMVLHLLHHSIAYIIIFEVIIKEWINLLDNKPRCRKSQDSTCRPGSAVVPNTLIHNLSIVRNPHVGHTSLLIWLLLIQASQKASKAENKGQFGNESLYMHNSYQVQKIPKLLIIVLIMSRPELGHMHTPSQLVPEEMQVLEDFQDYHSSKHQSLPSGETGQMLPEQNWNFVSKEEREKHGS